MKTYVRKYQEIENCSNEMAAAVVQSAREAVLEKGIFTLVLTGGKTVGPSYERLAQPPYSRQMKWDQTHFFWGDERFLPLKHTDSNKGMAYKLLLDKIPVPSENIHVIPTDTPTAAMGAKNYETEIRRFFGLPPHTWELPSFDLLLLGMGTDGHVASLFPGTKTLSESDKMTAAVTYESSSPCVERITLTIPVINKAKKVFFLISGQGKYNIMKTIHSDPDTSMSLYPAARVKPEKSITWFVDHADSA